MSIDKHFCSFFDKNKNIHHVDYYINDWPQIVIETCQLSVGERIFVCFDYGGVVEYEVCIHNHFLYLVSFFRNNILL